MGSTAAHVGLDRTALERQWTSGEARAKLGSADRGDWDSAKCTVRPYVYFDKVLIIWTYEQGQPQVREVLKVQSLDVSLQDGIWIKMYAEVAKRSVSINHVPRKLLDYNLFGWVPFFNELRYVPADFNDLDAPKNLRLSACFKSQHSSREPLVDGCTYISELHIFRSQWPAYRHTFF